MVWFWLCCLIAPGAAGSTPSPEGRDLAALASDLAWAPAVEVRRSATGRLHALADASDDVGSAVAQSFAWAPHRVRTFVGQAALAAELPMRPEQRIALATELLAWRLDIVSVGAHQVPARLTAELSGALRAEIEVHGEPTCTRDWLHLLGAAGGDVATLLGRLGLEQQGQWAHVAHQHQLLKTAPLTDVVPLLAHASAIVRSRAARRLEADPAEAMKALRRAWRATPGRAAPLRGDVGVPVLPWSEPDADKWSRTLVHWARRTNRQRDDRGLQAALRLLARPEVTTRLSEEQRLKLGQQLSRATRVHRTSARSGELIQAMDAVLRQVSWEDAHRPAPEHHEDTRPTWVRMSSEDEPQGRKK